MKRMTAVVFFVIAALLPSLTFGQAEHLKTADNVGMVVHRAVAAAAQPQLSEQLGPRIGMFHIQAWHRVGDQGCTVAASKVFFDDGTSMNDANGAVAYFKATGHKVIGTGCPFSDQWTHNLRTNAGADAQASQMANTSTQAASCNYGALAADSSNAGAGTVAATDTTIASSGTGSTELTTNGLGRVQFTYAHTNGTATFTLTHTFTDTTAQTAGINKTGIFNAASVGTMCFEALFTPVTLNVNDTLAETYTVNY